MFDWYCHINRPEIIGELPQERHLSIPAVVSGRFFDDSTCVPENKLKYQQTYSSCLNAYMNAGSISPKNSNPVKILQTETSESTTGTTTDCEFENLFEQTAKCPKGWAGKADDNQCYKIQTIPLTNNEAAGFCNQEGAELLQVESTDEDNVINEILFGVPEYSTPTHPGFYHIGMYQKQTANQYYHRNGVRV